MHCTDKNQKSKSSLANSSREEKVAVSRRSFLVLADGKYITLRVTQQPTGSRSSLRQRRHSRSSNSDISKSFHLARRRILRAARDMYIYTGEKWFSLSPSDKRQSIKSRLSLSKLISRIYIYIYALYNATHSRVRKRERERRQMHKRATLHRVSSYISVMLLWANEEFRRLIRLYRRSQPRVVYKLSMIVARPETH